MITEQQKQKQTDGSTFELKRIPVLRHGGTEENETESELSNVFRKMRG